MTQDVFDYIIVGAGSSGCVLADRLSADPRTQVLVLEAGGADSNPWIAVPKGIAFTLKNPKYAWHYPTEPFGPAGQVEYWMRGKVVGGSSSVNGMVYNRGSRADFDSIVSAGNPGWDWDEMLRIYRTIEDHSLGGSDTRGAGGPLKVTVRGDTEQVDELLRQSGAGLGIAPVDDVNASDGERIGYTPATIGNGLRCSAAKAFLKPALRRDNLTLRTGVLVNTVIFDGDRAVGVEGMAESGPVSFRARREIILSAGSIATPMLLERSGIGGREVLQSAGVDVRVDSPQIGENVLEHRCFPLQARLNKKLGYNSALRSPVGQGLAGLKWLLTRRGPIGTPAYDMISFVKSDPALERPDAQFLLTPFSMGLDGSRSSSIESRPGFSMLGFALRPSSASSIHIKSADPKTLPRIVPGYLNTDEDRHASVGMFRRMRQLVQQSPIADHVTIETVPGAAVDDDEAILRSGFLYGGTGYHACGAVRMGPRESDPVDSRLRVRGVTGLRVVDVSVFPSMLSGNLNAPAMAFAYRAAELIRDDS